MNCPKCGNPVPEGVAFCPTCGTSLKTDPSLFTTPGGSPAQTPVMTSVPAADNRAQIPPGYEPITPWGYVGYSLLFSIPIVGFILVLVFAFGGTERVNLRNYARGVLITIVIAVILGIFIGILAAVFGLRVGDYAPNYSFIRG